MTSNHFSFDRPPCSRARRRPARADVKLPAIFGDHMVAPARREGPRLGHGRPGRTRHRESRRPRESAATADATGQVARRARSDRGRRADRDHRRREEHVTIKDVLVGEVWVCSGQSNMGFPLKGAANGAEAVKAANRPTMRLFTVGRAIKDEPQAELTGKWEVCTPETAADFSAVAYFFGAELQDKLKTPVGLIEPSWGGTRAEAWIPRPAFDALKLPVRAGVDRAVAPPQARSRGQEARSRRARTRRRPACTTAWSRRSPATRSAASSGTRARRTPPTPPSTATCSRR